MLFGCKKENDDIALSVSKTYLYYDDTYQIEATSDFPVTYVSENEYHAKVSDAGLVTARHIGETNIILSNGKTTTKFNVTVKPRQNLYVEPNVKFGDTRSSIIAKFGTPDDVSSDGSSILYMDYSSSAAGLMFSFDDNDKLDGYSLMIKSFYASQLADFLIERYQIVSEKNGLYLFINSMLPSTATMAVGLQIYNSSYLIVTYIPGTTAKNNPMNISNKKHKWLENIF
jgi:hypothetical protein